jgi:tetratricopeptide (TPR) repeat protein
MSKPPEVDLEKAHRHFSADCYNQAWEYIDKPARTPEEDERMLMLSMASFWHWTQRPDCTAGNLSIGYWQLARVYTLLGRLEPARHYCHRCLEESQKEGTLPFHKGYAYEALARAEQAAGDTNKVKEFLALAREVSETMTDPDDKMQLLADLATIG